MRICETNEADVLVITLEGPLDSPAAPEVERAFSEALQKGASSIVVDLAGVEYISSSGLRVAIMLMKAINNRGGRLALCRLSPFVSDVFEMTHLADRFALCATREEALQLVRTPPSA